MHRQILKTVLLGEAAQKNPAPMEEGNDEEIDEEKAVCRISLDACASLLNFGFKPMDGRFICVPLYDEFWVLFGKILSEKEPGHYKAQTKLLFNAFGTMAMTREEFENNSASIQVFWLLKKSELTPSNANILDSRYSVFGYVVENEDYLADLKVGDVIESIQVVSGLGNLVNPSYKIAT